MNTRLLLLAAGIATLGLNDLCVCGELLAPGAKMVVALDRTELRVGDEVRALLPRGSEFTITGVSGQWAGGYVVVNGEKRTGWVASNRLVDRAQLTTVPASTPVPAAQAAPGVQLTVTGTARREVRESTAPGSVPKVEWHAVLTLNNQSAFDLKPAGWAAFLET